jgi:hypothetical protein
MVGVIGLVLSFLSFIFAIRSMSIDERPITGGELFVFVIALGAMAAFFHGIIWVGVEKCFRTNFLASTFRGAPRGIQAACLSASLTLPLIVLPAICHWGARLHVLRRPSIAYLFAALAVICGGVIAHLIMYGTNKPPIPGVKIIIYPPRKRVTYTAAILTELLYASVYFPLIVVPYRLIMGALDWQGVFWI